MCVSADIFDNDMSEGRLCSAAKYQTDTAKINQYRGDYATRDRITHLAARDRAGISVLFQPGQTTNHTIGKLPVISLAEEQCDFICNNRLSLKNTDGNVTRTGPSRRYGGETRSS